MKIRPVGAEFLHVDEGTDGQRDMMKLTVTFRNLLSQFCFRNFTEVPKKTNDKINTEVMRAFILVHTRAY